MERDSGEDGAEFLGYQLVGEMNWSEKKGMGLEMLREEIRKAEEEMKRKGDER